ncbi:TniB family NTP-binding protein [Microbacterium testaceum]|uniref:TniB family NTP-binding protein n=1 Tax=Microbacterium testaceum TaxID=2033 RepID=UPI00124680C4|nr:TniB family NTP-binding protein [Microbacterium testaceum]
MTTETLADPTLGHFDHREVLSHLLETDTSSSPEEVSLATYKNWKPGRRHAFDERRSERIANSFVIQTPSLRQLSREYRRASLFANRPIGRTGILLSGPAASGKTTAAFRTMVDALRRHAARHPNWQSLGHTPVVYVEIPPGCNAKNLMGRFMTFFGLPVPPRMTAEERTHAVTELLIRSRTSLVVFDEMQNLARVGQGQFESAQAIKNLMNSVRAVPLYVGIDLENTALVNNELGAQFAARCSMVRLNKMDISTPAGRRLWGGVIVEFERQLGLFAHPPETLLPEAAYLWEQTRGSLGALTRLLAFAALELIHQGEPDREVITRSQLEELQMDYNTERERAQAADRLIARKGEDEDAN